MLESSPTHEAFRCHVCIDQILRCRDEQLKTPYAATAVRILMHDDSATKRDPDRIFHVPHPNYPSALRSANSSAVVSPPRVTDAWYSEWLTASSTGPAANASTSDSVSTKPM